VHVVSVSILNNRFLSITDRIFHSIPEAVVDGETTACPGRDSQYLSSFFNGIIRFL